MSTRFRKSVKITKGTRINFSKSGASVSLGGKGYGMSFGKRGPRAHIGIPGTGLSYSTKIGGKSHSSSRSRSSSKNTSSKPTVKMPKQISIRMDDKGKIIIFDETGAEITNQTILKKIKGTSQYQMQVDLLNEQRKEKINELIRDEEAENERFINIHRASATVDSLSSFQKQLDNLKPAEYVEKEFDIPAPTAEQIRWELEGEAEKKVTGSIFKIGKLKKQYVEDNLDQRYASALSAWETERDTFYSNQAEDKKTAERIAAEECEEQKALLALLIDGDDSAVSHVLDTWISECELPVEIDVSYDWNQEINTMLLDIDLPEIEDLATTKLTKTDAGNIKEKKKTQAELRNEYSTLVFGLAIFISSHVFNVSPAIKKVLLSGYTQRRDKEGNMNDDYVYSFKFTRDKFEQCDLTTVDPIAFCLSVENRCNMSSTSLLKTIVPYDSFE